MKTPIAPQLQSKSDQDFTQEECEPENNITVSPTPTKQPNKTLDSNTFVYIGLNEPREPCSFRGNKKLHKAFIRQLKFDSLSACHIIEPVELAYLTGRVYNCSTINDRIPPLVIEQFNVARVLKRLRRIGVEGLSSVEVDEESQSVVEVPESCFYCGALPVWRCETIFKGDPVKFLCQSHASMLDRRSEILSKERLEVF